MSSKVPCIKCEIFRAKIFSKYRARTKLLKIFVDETGRQWSGRTCANCVMKRQSVKNMTIPDKGHRICRRCKKPMQSNWFTHPKCQIVTGVSTESELFLYH